MFNYTTTTYYRSRKQRYELEDIIENKIDDADRLTNLIEVNIQLEEQLEEQIQCKRNKEFFYTNINKIKRRFYHFRDKNNHPRITVCTVYDTKENIACRGISLCSFMDQTNKENGRDRAEDRALKAYKTAQSSEPIIPEFIIKDESTDNTEIVVKLKVDEVIKSVTDFEEEIQEKVKSAFDVKLTPFERKLFALDREETIKV